MEKAGVADRVDQALKRRHILAATIGNALEFYDFLIYAFFAIQIGHAFFPAQSAYGSLMLSLATFGAGFVTRPIGALFIGAYADRVGRRPAMMLCFVLIGCSIVAMAMIPSYAAIGVAAPILAVIARMAQGFSLGGEVGSNTAFLLEAAPTGQRGFVVAWQVASQLMAQIVGGLVGVTLTMVMSPSALAAYGWRIAFLFGALLAPFGLWLRTSLPETLHAPDPFALTPTEDPSKWALVRAHWRVFILGLMVLAAGTIGGYIISYMVTYAQDTLKLSPRVAFLGATCASLVGIPAVLLGGWTSDRIGRRPVNIAGTALLLFVIYPIFAWFAATRSELALIAGMLVLGIATNTIWGSFCANLAESMPKTIRGRGFGTVYSISIAAFGGTTQLAVTWLIHFTGSPMAPAWYLVVATAVGLIAAILMPESAPVRRRRPATGHLAAELSV